MQTSWSPDRKVLAGGVAGLVAWALVLLAGRYGIVIDPAVQPALVMLVGTAMAYFIPPAAHDVLKRLDNELVKSAQEDPRYPKVTPP